MTISGNAACILALALVATPAQANGSLFDSFAKSTGLMSAPPDPPDFVKATRPKAEPTSIPVFATPDEPSSKVKTPSELKAMDADLERASHSQDVIRGGARGKSAGAAKSKRHDIKVNDAAE